MKSIFIAFNQAYNMEIADILDRFGCRGFTMWKDVAGRGSVDGEPHYGDHAWPTLNNAILAMVPDEKVDDILQEIRIKDEETPALGLSAYVWSIEKAY
ncbi:MAG: PG0541 family transporter-associated protein [Candidatus Cryptobacteroides sp.]